MRENLRAVVITALVATGACGLSLPVDAQRDGRSDDTQRTGSPPTDDRGDEARTDEIERVSPVRRIRRDDNPLPVTLPAPEGIRSIDGTDNNATDPLANASHTALFRWLPLSYSDGIAALAGESRPNPRAISNAVLRAEGDRPNDRGASDFLWQWGQFLDHDIDLTDGADPEEPAPIAIPAGDIWFDPEGTGQREMEFNRSLYVEGSGTSTVNPRQQVNEITGWIDASNVYGSDSVRADALRTNDGTGQLATSEGDFLPFNVDALPNAGGDSDTLFLAGDVRANEQVGLSAMHTLFVREHNRIARDIARRSSRLSGDEVYEQARRIVGAQMQVITYNEFLPLLLGDDALPPYEGYDPDIDARIANSFSTAAFRLGHSLLSPQLLRLDAGGEAIDAGHLPLRSAFFSPGELTETGLEPFLRGLATQACQELDVFLVDDIRNFLFGAPGSDGFDLASLNIQRGRDHGLPSYNDARVAIGLAPVERFVDVSSDPVVQAQLASVYASVDDIDLWVGGLAEDHVRGAMVGPTFRQILVSQFGALRDGDRFWYERMFSGRELRDLQRTRLSDIIRRNTDIGRELSDDVFRVAGRR